MRRKGFIVGCGVNVKSSSFSAFLLNSAKGRPVGSRMRPFSLDSRSRSRYPRRPDRAVISVLRMNGADVAFLGIVYFPGPQHAPGARHRHHMGRVVGLEKVELHLAQPREPGAARLRPVAYEAERLLRRGGDGARPHRPGIATCGRLPIVDQKCRGVPTSIRENTDASLRLLAAYRRFYEAAICLPNKRELHLRTGTETRHPVRRDPQP